MAFESLAELIEAAKDEVSRARRLLLEAGDAVLFHEIALDNAESSLRMAKESLRIAVANLERLQGRTP